VTLILRRPWGTLNPHGLDRERWLIASGYSATGYLREGWVCKVHDVTPVRARWISAVNALLATRASVNQGTLKVLLTGDGSAVTVQTLGAVSTHRRDTPIGRVGTTCFGFGGIALCADQLFAAAGYHRPTQSLGTLGEYWFGVSLAAPTAAAVPVFSRRYDLRLVAPADECAIECIAEEILRAGC